MVRPSCVMTSLDLMWSTGRSKRTKNSLLLVPIWAWALGAEFYDVHVPGLREGGRHGNAGRDESSDCLATVHHSGSTCWGAMPDGPVHRGNVLVSSPNRSSARATEWLTMSSTVRGRA